MNRRRYLEAAVSASMALAVLGSATAGNAQEASPTAARPAVDPPPAGPPPPSPEAQQQPGALLDPRVDQARFRDAELDREIAALREERRELSLAGPITVLAIGGGTVAFAGAFFLTYAMADSIESACRDSHRNDDYYHCVNEDHGTEMTVTGVVAACGAVVGVVGGIWLADRIGERRENSRRINELERQRVGYDLVLRPDLAMGTVRAVF